MPRYTCFPIDRADFIDLSGYKVENVSILHHGQTERGTLHLTAHHLIFKRDQTQQEDGQEKKLAPNEIWIAYPIIGTAHRHPPSAASPPHIRLRNRDFSFVQFRFETDRECRDVFQSIKDLTVIKGGVEKLYAYFYQPMAAEKRSNGWTVYDPLKEYQRMGVGTDRCMGWRVSNINQDYSVRKPLPHISELSLMATVVFPNISFHNRCPGDHQRYHSVTRKSLPVTGKNTSPYVRILLPTERLKLIERQLPTPPQQLLHSTLCTAAHWRPRKSQHTGRETGRSNLCLIATPRVFPNTRIPAQFHPFPLRLIYELERA